MSNKNKSFLSYVAQNDTEKSICVTLNECEESTRHNTPYCQIAKRNYRPFGRLLLFPFKAYALWGPRKNKRTLYEWRFFGDKPLRMTRFRMTHRTLRMTH